MKKEKRTYSALAALIRRAREKKGIRQGDLAAKIGAHPSALATTETQHYTSSGVTRPQIGERVFARLISVLGVRRSELDHAVSLSRPKFTLTNLSPAHAAAGAALDAAWNLLTDEDLAKIEYVAARRSGK